MVTSVKVSGIVSIFFLSIYRLEEAGVLSHAARGSTCGVFCSPGQSTAQRSNPWGSVER